MTPRWPPSPHRQNRVCHQRAFLEAGVLWEEDDSILLGCCCAPRLLLVVLAGLLLLLGRVLWVLGLVLVWLLLLLRLVLRVLRLLLSVHRPPLCSQARQVRRPLGLPGTAASPLAAVLCCWHGVPVLLDHKATLQDPFCSMHYAGQLGAGSADT